MEALLTVDEVAAILKIHPVTLRNWARALKIRAINTGSHWKFEETDLALWVKQNAQG
jgi:excisionase family DNA binding protein